MWRGDQGTQSGIQNYRGRTGRIPRSCPAEIPVPTKIQGIGAGFIPKVSNRTLLDRVITVTDDEAYQTAKMLAKKEGLLVGISAGANVFAAQKIAEEWDQAKTSSPSCAIPASATSVSKSISTFDHLRNERLRG